MCQRTHTDTHTYFQVHPPLCMRTLIVFYLFEIKHKTSMNKRWSKWLHFLFWTIWNGAEKQKTRSSTWLIEPVKMPDLSFAVFPSQFVQIWTERARPACSFVFQHPSIPSSLTMSCGPLRAHVRACVRHRSAAADWIMHYSDFYIRH